MKCPVRPVDGMNPEVVAKEMDEAISRARRGGWSYFPGITNLSIQRTFYE